MDPAVVLVDVDDAVLLANPAARALGIVRGSRLLVPELLGPGPDGPQRRQPPGRRPAARRPRRLRPAADGGARRPAAQRHRAAARARSRWCSQDVTETRRIEAVRRDFVANVSHELKTPVGALALLAEAIEQAADDPEAVQRFAGRIAREADRLARLVHELIDLSRLQGGEPLPELVPVEVDDVHRRGGGPHPHRRRGPRSSTSPSAAQQGLVVRGVESQLATAVTNLLANAVAYSPGETRIAVAARARSGFAEIAVTDSGIGIPRKDRQRVFERFYRVDQARASSTGGTGLGLAIVKHVASNHGGSVTVWSEEGLGSTFTLRIPLRRHARRDVRSADDPSTPSLEGTFMTRVLVVEDEESFSDALSYMLRKEGFEAVVAGDRTGRARRVRPRRRRHRAARPDAAGLPGTEVCRALRSRSNVPIIMLTAKDSEIDKVVGLELGADDYVTKPYSARELVARIRAVLRRRGDAAETPPGDGVLEAGPVRMDVERHVVAVDGETVALPLKEFDLLEYLLRNAGRVLTRGQLIDRVWGADYVGDTKTLDVHVKRLRAKVEPDPANPKYLVTVRGLGYKLEA